MRNTVRCPRYLYIPKAVRGFKLNRCVRGALQPKNNLLLNSSSPHQFLEHLRYSLSSKAQNLANIIVKDTRMAPIIDKLNRDIQEKQAMLDGLRNNLREGLDIVNNIDEKVTTMFSSGGSLAQEREKENTLRLRESIRQCQDEMEHAILTCELEIAELRILKLESQMAKFRQE